MSANCCSGYPMCKCVIDIKVNDKRRWAEDYKHTDEVCRVCGAVEVHSSEYGKPTMGCIEYLRSQIKPIDAIGKQINCQ